MARFQCYRTEESAVRWRLLGGNNRVLGVCVRGHRDHGEAVGEIELVRRAATTMSYTVVHADGGLWWWRLGSLARSAQGFARRVDAELAAGRFRRRVTDAGHDPELAVFSTGRRRGTRGANTDVWPQRPVG